MEYYRYLRFFSDGTVLYLTSPDEPKSTVAKLKSRSINVNNNPLNTYYNSFHLNEHSILKGTWTLALSRVHIVLCKRINRQANKYSRRQANKDREPLVEQEHVFRMVKEKCMLLPEKKFPAISTMFFYRNSGIPMEICRIPRNYREKYLFENFCY